MSISKFRLGISRLKRNSQGFAMAEAIVALGMIGIITLAVISQQKLSTKNAQVTSSEVEINNITNRIIAQMSEEATCSANFSGKTQDNPNISSLVSATGTAFLVKGSTIGTTGSMATHDLTTTSEIYVENIETVASVVPNVPAANVNGNEMILRIYFRKKDSSKSDSFLTKWSNRTVRKDIPLNTVFRADGKINMCFGDFDLLAKNAVESSCRGNSSLYEAPSVTYPYGRCKHKNSDVTCPPGQYLKQVAVGATASSHDINYTCTSLENMCPAGKFITGFNTDGTVTCGYALKACNPGDVIVKNTAGAHVCATVDCTGVSPISAFAGFNSTGAPICNPIYTAGVNCGGDNYATQINANGSVTCNPMLVSGGSCPVGSRVQGINASGGVNCVPYIVLPFGCSTDQAVSGFDAAGNAICKPINRPLACDGTKTLHTYRDCYYAGGSPAYMGTANSMCIFNGASCPGGWGRCYSFGTQSNGVCLDTSNTGYCDGNRSYRYAVPYGGNGAWQNAGQNYTQCISWAGYPNTGHACYVAGYYGPTYTIQNTVGCY